MESTQHLVTDIECAANLCETYIRGLAQDNSSRLPVRVRAKRPLALLLRIVLARTTHSLHVCPACVAIVDADDGGSDRTARAYSNEGSAAKLPRNSTPARAT